jgi:hypothetical protein
MENTINDIDGIVNYHSLIFFYMQITWKLRQKEKKKHWKGTSLKKVPWIITFYYLIYNNTGQKYYILISIMFTENIL